jgi:hypothetical protein
VIARGVVVIMKRTVELASQPGNFLVEIFAFLAIGISPANAGVDTFHNLYEKFQSEYWHESTIINDIQTTAFNYAAMTRDAIKPDSLYFRIIKSLEQVKTPLPVNKASEAFWINVYNFAAMKLVIENYPVKSIRDFKISLLRYPWSKKVIQVGDQVYSLAQIEKDILLKIYQDPRIIFAVSCASVSCPDRRPGPYTGGQLDKQLNDLIHEFFRNPTKGMVMDKENNTLIISSILKTDSHLFDGSGDSLKSFLCLYVEVPVCNWIKRKGVAIDYLKHDWTLNDITFADE